MALKYLTIKFEHERILNEILPRKRRLRVFHMVYNLVMISISVVAAAAVVVVVVICFLLILSQYQCAAGCMCECLISFAQ